MIPESYDQWVHCITVRCGISLTSEYASKRLKQLRNAGDQRTGEFRRLYGDEHWRRVIDWFEKSLSEKSG